MADMKRNYEILGLKPGASLEDAKSAYRDLVQVWHPDRFSHNPSLQKKAEEKLKEINGAYESVKTHLESPSRNAVQSGTNKSTVEHQHTRTEERKSSPPSRPRSRRAPITKESVGRKYFNLILIFLILYAVGYGVYLYMQPASKENGETVKGMTLPQGLQITTATGSVDANQDYIVSGVIENTTNEERPEWYLVVDVLDARGRVLDSARMWNGKQLYTKKDYEVLAKREVNVEELKEKNLHGPGVSIPPKGTVRFEIRFMEWPANIASFNVKLQPFDPVRLYKEIYLSNILPENAEHTTR